jgi:hypothetical protein
MELRTLTSETAAFPPPFVEGEDLVLATAKKRPALVVASRRELAIGRNVRVVPIRSKADKPFYTANWAEIEAGHVAGLIAMPSDPAFGFDEGVLDLTDAQRIHRAFLPVQPWFRLDDGSLGGVLLAMQALLATALRRPRRN